MDYSARNAIIKHHVGMTAWYLNVSRVQQLICSAGTGLHELYRAADVPSLARNLRQWLHANEVPSLGEIFARDALPTEGQRFSIYHDFYGRGLSKYRFPSIEIPRDAVADVHCTLSYDKNYRLTVPYHPTGLTCTTAWSKLSGHPRLFVLAYAERVSNDEVQARPYVIADLHGDLPQDSPAVWNAGNYGEVHPAAIEQFSLMGDQFKKETSAPPLSLLKSIPERRIKSAIAEILHEGSVPKDWAGERSDLFSSNLSVNGRRLSAAFLLKGPASFSPMTMKHLGKSGDQIDRLFTEPADLLVLQHCHRVTSAVRSTMRAYAQRIHDLRHFTILDGYDTIRLLRAYGKCGLSSEEVHGSTIAD